MPVVLFYELGVVWVREANALRSTESNLTKTYSKEKTPATKPLAGVSFLHFFTPLVKREEKEIGGHPFAGNAWGFARVGTRAVAYCAVALHFTNAGAAAVAHRTITVKPADARARTIAEGTVPIDLADAGTTAVTDSAIAIEAADTGATAIADGAVALNFSTARTATVVYGLRHCTRCHQEAGSQN